MRFLEKLGWILWRVATVALPLALLGVVAFAASPDAQRLTYDRLGAVLPKSLAEQLAAMNADPLDEPTLPTHDEFGYPTSDVDPRDVIALLHERRFEELTSLLAARHEAALRDFRHEMALEDAYAPFLRTDPELARLLAEWIEQMPEAPEARLALAEHRLAVAEAMRETDGAGATAPSNSEQMRRYAAAALEELNEALRLDSTQLYAYAVGISANHLLGARDGAREMLRRGLEISPHSLVLRNEMSFWLWPAWGGSYAQLEELAREAEPYAEVNPALRTLNGQVHVARGYSLGTGGNCRGAIQQFTQALESGENWLARYLRARCFQELGAAKRALADLNRAWMQRPYSADVLALRAFTYFALAEEAGTADRTLLLGRAERDVSLALELDPDEGKKALLLEIWRAQAK